MVIGVTVAKVISMVFSGGVSMLLGLLPIKLRTFIDSQNVRLQTVFSGILCFGGGILMATCFTHVLPEVRFPIRSPPGQIRTGLFDLKVREYFDEGRNSRQVPVADILLCFGFFLSYFIEEFVRFTSDRTLTNNSHTCPQQHQLQSTDGHVEASSHSSACGFREEEQCMLSEDQELSREQLPSVKHLLMVVALSSHSVFEGLAVGLADTANSVWALFFGKPW